MSNPEPPPSELPDDAPGAAGGGQRPQDLTTISEKADLGIALTQALGRTLDSTTKGLVNELTEVRRLIDEHIRAVGSDGQNEPKTLPWVQRASKADWDALIDWVEDMYDLYKPPSGMCLPPCWPHPDHWGIAEELAALHSAWLSAADQDAASRAKRTGSDDLAYWHERFWWPTLERLGRFYQLTGLCRGGHPSSVREAPTPANREMLPQHLQMDPPEPDAGNTTAS